jgi:hypothetical protein
MLFSSYLRNGAVYVPTVVKLQTGAYVDVEPVAVTAAADTEGLRRAFLDAIARKNAVVPPPPKDKWPPPVLLKYAGVKTGRPSPAAQQPGVSTKRTEISKSLAIETIPTDIGRRTPRKKSIFPPARGLKW